MKDVVRFENLYKVSEDGQVWSVFKKDFKIQNVNKDGYKVVSLSKDNKAYTKTVHRIVAQAFIPNPENLPTVNHKDGNKENNCVNNLEWMSFIDNDKHAQLNNLKYKPSKMLNDSQEETCIKLYKEYKNISIVAKEMGISISLVSKTLGIHNIATEGMEGKKHSKEAKEKMSRSRKGKPSPARGLDCFTVVKIRDYIERTDFTNKKIAELFGVGQHVIGNIRKGTAYVEC